MTTQILTQGRLRSLLVYDPDTGVFTNRITRNPRAKVGAPAGALTSEGYIAFQIGGAKIYAHRAAWLYVYGVWPDIEIDHINRQRSDNRIANLRLATRCQNGQNTGAHKRNLTGHKGVTFHARSKKWQVQLRANSKTFYVGQYAELADAVQARAIAEVLLHRND
jgi:hypothetical protein